jgi:hypothetical protein
VGWTAHPGLLWAPTERLFDALQPVVGEHIATHGVLLLLATLPGVMSLLTYGWLRSGAPGSNGYLHCLRWGHILKGLSQPRCPECGEPI